MTLVVNLYGGPGTGKSTTAALVFGRLKQAGVNAELVTEFAKDLAWEDRSVIRCRPFVFGEQLWRIERLLGRVDVIVTDSPLLMDIVYSKHYGTNWCGFVLEEHKKLSTLDVFLQRDNVVHPFNPKGRFQDTVEEAEQLDHEILTLLTNHGVPHVLMRTGEADRIVEEVLKSRENA